jgi:hypothetical protein
MTVKVSWLIILTRKKTPLKQSIITVPVVVVFTQYDTFVTWFESECDNCKSCLECEKCMNFETCEKRKSSETCENCKKAAKDVYDEHVKALKKAAKDLGIKTPEYINVSGASALYRERLTECLKYATGTLRISIRSSTRPRKLLRII